MHTGKSSTAQEGGHSEKRKHVSSQFSVSSNFHNVFFFFKTTPPPTHTHTHTHTHARAHTFNLYCIFSLCFDKFLFPPQNKQKREKGVFMFPATLTEPRHTATACTISGLKSQRKNMYACKRNISGPVTNLLSVLCILMQMLKWKKKEQA